MAALDKMIIDDRDLATRYFGENNLDDLEADQFLFSKQTKTNQQELNSKSKKKDDDLSGLFGRRVYLESPSFDTKEEEDMYRYVPSRLSEVPATMVGASAPAATTETLIDSLDFELDLFGAANTRHGVPYRASGQYLKDSKPPAPLTHLKNPSKPLPPTNVPRADPRQDPLLGPLLAELDAMTTQQQHVPQLPVPAYRRNSVPYDSNLTRLPVPSLSNHVLTTTANRTVNDALFEAELYDSLDLRDQYIPPVQERQHIIFSAPNTNSSHHPQPQQPRLPPRPLNMNNIDIFMPSSYDNGPGSYSNQFGANDQVFQQPLLNALGQNYVPNQRPSVPAQQPQQQQQQPQPAQRDRSYDDIYSRMSPPQRTALVPSQQPPNATTNNNRYQPQQQPPPPSSHHQQQQQQQRYEQPDPMFDDLYSQISPPHRGTYPPSQQPQNANNQYQQQQQQQQLPPPNQQTTYNNNNNDDNDPFKEFESMYGASQHQRPPQAPLQQHPPPPSQQPRTMPPPPPSFQQPRMMPPASQQPRMMPPPPPSSFQQPRMMPPPSQQQTMVPRQPPPSSFQQPRMMPPAPPSFQPPRMMPPPPASQQPRMPPPQFSQQQQYQKPPFTTQLNEDYQRSSPNAQQQQQQYYDEEILPSNYPSNNQDMFFTDINDDPFDQASYHDHQQQPPSMTNQDNVDQQEDQDSKRQAIWNELQRTNVKVQEKNAKKRESANRREQMLKGNFSSNTAWNSVGSKVSSAQSKAGAHSPPTRRPPPAPAPVSKTNYIEDNIDMIKNKENFYHRYPAKKYENLYSKRKDLSGGGNNNQNDHQNPNNNFDQGQPMHHPTATYSNTEQHSNLPVTINLNPGNNSQNPNAPATVSFPLDSHVTRVGDKISVNIDVRLLDLQNMRQQQQQQNNERPDWTGLDPLDRHIRKLENSIDQKSKKKFIECRWINCSCQRRRQQSLPQTHSPPRRSSPPSNPVANASMGRYGKMTAGGSHSGYSPPHYKTDHHSYSAKGREEDSYLSKMNPVKKTTQYKPYTGRDYEQFKKNYAFGTGNLGFDYDNPDYKEKSDKISKTKEYAQQIEARNKKKLADAPRRTLSETRKASEPSTTQRALEYARVATRHKIPVGSATESPSPYQDEPAPLQRRPTEIPHRPPPVQKQPTKVFHNDDDDLVERLAMRHERDKAQVQGILNPSQKRREQLFDDDRRMSEIEKLAQERANQRRLSPPKQLPPNGSTNLGNTRRPLRFDNPILSDELIAPPPPPQQQQRPIQQQIAQQHPTQPLSAQQKPPVLQHQTVLQQQPQQPVQQHPPQQQQHPPAQPHPPIQQQQQQQPQNHQTNVDELANRHNDEKILMEAIRKELRDRPLDDDEELVVVEQ